MYDLEKLSWRIEAKRRKFKILASVYSIMAIAGFLLTIINENKIRMGGFVLIGAGVFLFIHLINKYSPMLLFSPDIKGISIKEHEYVATRVARASSAAGRSIGKKTTVILPLVKPPGRKLRRSRQKGFIGLCEKSRMTGFLGDFKRFFMV